MFRVPGRTAHGTGKGWERTLAKNVQTRKRPSFWRSKEAKRVLWVLGIPAAILIGWYAYTLAFHFNQPAMTRMEAGIKRGIADLTDRALKEGFRAEEVDKCQNMIKEYTTPKGWFYSDADIHQLVGLPREATQQQMNDRCIYYAKAVATMEKLAHHGRHAFVCGASLLDVGGGGQYYIKADPEGRGAVQSLDPRGEKLVEIPRQTSTIINTWQVYNVGDGCVIVGLSKASAFRMSGKILREP